MDVTRQSDEDIERVLVFALSGIGNMVNTTPLLAACRDVFPRAEQVIVASQRGADAVISGGRLADRITFAPPSTRSVSGAAMFGRTLRSTDRTVAIVARASHGLRSNIMAWASGAPVRVGYVSKGSFLLTKTLPIRMGRHEVDLNRDLLRAIGFECPSYEPEVSVTAADRQVAEAALIDAGRPQRAVAALSPGSYEDMKSKRWPAEHFAALGDRIVAGLGMNVAIFGGPEEAELAQRIAGLMSLQPIVLTGKLPLKATAAALGLCSVAVANCNGLMHLAAAMGTPTVAIYGPTDWQSFGPYGRGHVIVREDLPCSPCYTVRTIGRSVTCPRNVECLRVLSVEKVYGAVAQIAQNLCDRVDDEMPRNASSSSADGV